MNAAGTGLKARTVSLETATANLQTGKADASRVTVLESRASAPPNEFGNSDLSQGRVGFKTQWNGAGGAVDWGIYADFLYAKKQGGGYLDAPGVTTLGSLDFGGGPFPPSSNGFGLRAWRVAQGERIGFAFDARDESAPFGWPPGRWSWAIRIFNEDGSNAEVVASGASTYGNGSWDRVGNVFTAPKSGFLTIEAYLQSNGAPTDSVSVNARRFTFCRLDPSATALPLYSANGDGVANSRLTITEQATTDLYGRTRARWALGAAVPGATAFMQAQAEVTAGQAPTSSVAIGAQQFAVYNQIGQNWLKALEVVGGNVLLTGGLQAGAFIRLGNGNGWPVALKPVDFSAADGEVVSFGTDLGGLPALQFALNNLAPLNSGETYDVRASSLTSTGFTMYAKINVPATPSNQSVDRRDINQQSTTIEGITAVYVNFDGRPEAADGTYTIQADGYTNYRVPRRTEVTDYEGGGLLRVWARKGGAWVQVGNVSYSWSDLQGNPSSSDITASAGWSIYEVMQLGSGVTGVAVGVPQPQEMPRRTAYAIGCGPIQWQAQGSASGVRSATPNGQKTRVTVRPQ